MSDTIIREDTDKQLDDVDSGDHDRFAHYVLGRNPKAKITKAIIEGRPIRALCGKKWVPSRDPARFPVCPECKAIRDKLLRKPAE